MLFVAFNSRGLLRIRVSIAFFRASSAGQLHRTDPVPAIVHCYTEPRACPERLLCWPLPLPFPSKPLFPADASSLGCDSLEREKQHFPSPIPGCQPVLSPAASRLPRFPFLAVRHSRWDQRMQWVELRDQHSLFPCVCICLHTSDNFLEG